LLLVPPNFAPELRSEDNPRKGVPRLRIGFIVASFMAPLVFYCNEKHASSLSPFAETMGRRSSDI
jgi:hypothetical protein